MDSNDRWSRKKLDRLRTAKDDWATVYDHLPDADRRDYVKDLYRLAMYAARMGGYFMHRAQGYGHADSLKHGEKSARAVGTAMGYPLP